MDHLQLPGYLTGQRRQIAADAVAGMGMAPVPYLSIEENKFTLIDAAGNEWNPQTYGPIFTTVDQNRNVVAQPGSPVGLYIDVVVVDTNPVTSKVYYINPYSPQAQRFLPPDCWSDNGVAPSIAASRPQNDTCELCPHNRWGSKVNALGNEVKACDDVKKLAIAVPQLVGNGMRTIFLFRLKGSSHKNWRTYIEKLSKVSVGDRTLDPTDVVTRIYLQDGKIGVLDFYSVTLIDQAVAALEDEVWQARATDQMVGRLDRPRAPTGLLAAPTAAALGGGHVAPAPPPAAYAPPPPAPPAGFGGQPVAQHTPSLQTQPGQDFGRMQPQPQPQPRPQPQPTFQGPAQPGYQQPGQPAPPPQQPTRRRGRGKAAAAPEQPATQPGQPTSSPNTAPNLFPTQPAPAPRNAQPPFPAGQPSPPAPSAAFPSTGTAQPPGPAPHAPPASPSNPPTNFGMGNPGSAPAAVAASLADALGPLPGR